MKKVRKEGETRKVKQKGELCGVPGRIRTCGSWLGRQKSTLKQLNKVSLSQLAELNNVNKYCVSQVKHGKRSPSQNCLDITYECLIRFNEVCAWRNYVALTKRY